MYSLHSNSELALEETPEEHEAVSKLGEMAAKIAVHNFEWRYDTMVMFNLLHLIAIESFFKNYQRAITVKKGKYTTIHVGFRPKFSQFVIFGLDTAEITDLLQWLASEKYDNTAKYIIVCSSTEHEKCDENSITQVLSDVYIANFVLLKLSVDYKPQAFSFYPVLPEKCWKTEPEILNITHDCSNDSCYKNAFPEKFYNLYGCPLVISTFVQPPYMYLTNGTPRGGDGDILLLVKDMLNSSLTVKTPLDLDGWGHYKDGNWTGSLGDAFNGRAHGSMCASPLTPGKFGNFQISFTYNSMDMVWIAALPALKPSWQKLLYPFKICIRIALACVFIGIILMNTYTKTKIWKKVRTVLKIPPPKSNLLFQSWILFLGMPTVKLPSKHAFRLAIFTWIWFCVIIRSVYQGALVNFLKLHVYENRLDTFRDVQKFKYPYGGLPSLRDYYYDNPEVYNNWQSLQIAESLEIFDLISAGSTNFVLAMNKETAIDRLITYKGNRQIQIIPEKIVNSPTVIYFKKNSHLTNPISHYLTIILEGGFAHRLYARYVDYLNTLFQPSNTEGPKPLRLEHFTGSLIILIVGWILSLIFFIVEVICGRQ